MKHKNTIARNHLWSSYHLYIYIHINYYIFLILVVCLTYPLTLIFSILKIN